jgi:hypothetical protein
VWSATLIDDDADGPSIGDGDGLADLGETLQFLMELHNVGPEDALNSAVTISCEDPRIVIHDATASYGTVPAGGTGYNLDDLLVEITPEIQDGDVIQFDLEITCDGRWLGTDRFMLTLHAPILSIASWEIDDTVTGDGEGDVDPGETFQIRVTLENSGGDEGRDVTALLMCWGVFLNMEQNESGAAIVPCGGTAELEPPFAATLDLMTPTDQVLRMNLRATTWAGQLFVLRFDVPVASLFEDCLEEESGWTAGAPGDDATEGVWVRVDPVGTYIGSNPVQPEDDHTPLGTDCFVTGQGGQGQSPLLSDVDDGKTTLLSPTIDLREAIEPRLIYWRWYTNNLGPYGGEDFWQVDISDDGGDTWVGLEYTQESENQWRKMEFYLTDYIGLTDQMVLRFIASDYGGMSLVEAAIDDISVESLPNLADVADDANDTRPRALSFGLGAISPNPLSLSGASGRAGSTVLIRYSLPATSKVVLRIFDVDGGLVRTLAHGAHEPGDYRAAWDGRDQNGRLLPSGIYFCRLKAAGDEDSRKMVVLK